ncbi:MAG: glycosyltransferase family 39 protein [Chloroflexota bacterium]|nr:glycosyltransferase family 39 protein [Chloroflexota bacterium]
MTWLNEALAGILPTLWMSVGLGLPWSLALLPRRQWQSRALVAAVALAVGPACMTAWMLVLGVLGAQTGQGLLVREWIILGSVLIAALGGRIAWRKGRGLGAVSAPRAPFAFDEKLIVAMIATAVALRWIHTAYWPFTAYDALWVYGYQGRLYFLEGLIPQSIEYYPPFLQLQYAYVQILIGAINDYAARMVLPWLHIGGIFAAYLLGERLLKRRVGLFAAALWSLHPFVGQQSIIGDLEIALAFSFTLAAVFFLRAWREQEDEREGRREALLAGLMLGISLFTKPTGGAFIWGVLLLLALEAARAKLQFGRLKPRFMVAFWTILASAPLGGVWYLRNLLLGHEAITWPADFWLTQARRSGDYLSWIVLAIIAGFAAAAIKRRLPARQVMIGAAGTILLLVGVTASNPIFFPERFDPPTSHIQLSEAAAMALGITLIGASLYAQRRRLFAALAGPGCASAGWALLLALPYFLTFFFSYSYHYRLGFAIVPLLVIPTAAALASVLSPDRISGWRPLIRRLYYLTLLLLGAPGIVSAAVDVTWSRAWLFDGGLDSDASKYQVYNPSLMEMVFGLEEYLRENERAPLVLAPGEERLHFFFPRMRIEDMLISTLDEYEALGATHFIYGAKARQAYLDGDLDPRRAQLIAALGREDIFQLKKAHYDGTFSYELYESGDFASRVGEPSPGFVSNVYERELLFGDRLRLYATDAYPRKAYKGTPLTLLTIWRAEGALEQDYHIMLELTHPETQVAEYQWRFVPVQHRHGYYSTALWEAGELVNMSTVLRLPSDEPLPPEDDYVLRLRVLDPESGLFLPLRIDGAEAGDAWQLDGIYKFRS